METATRLLVIAHIDHAAPRITGLARHLALQGWQVDVVSPPSDRVPEDTVQPAASVRYHQTWRYRHRGPLAHRKRSIAMMLWRALRLVSRKVLINPFDWPDYFRRWESYGTREALRLVTVHPRPTAILSSSSPPTCHRVARVVAIRSGIPWVADLRDLWSQNHNYQYSALRNFFERIHERRVLRHARALVTVSSAMAHRLRSLHAGTPVHVDSHGFEPTNGSVAPPDSQAFRVTYTGQIYPNRMHWRGLLAALHRFAEGARDPGLPVRIQFVGGASGFIEPHIDPTLRSRFELTPYVSHDVAVGLQQRSDVLLFLDWVGNRRGVGSLKFYEYLGSGRPIVAYGNGFNDVIRDTLLTTGAGWFCRSADEVVAALDRAYSEKSNLGSVQRAARPGSTEQFSYPVLAQRLSSILLNPEQGES